MALIKTGSNNGWEYCTHLHDNTQLTEPTSIADQAKMLCRKHRQMELVHKLHEVHMLCTSIMDAHLNAGVCVELLNNASFGVCPGHILLHATIVRLQATP